MFRNDKAPEPMTKPLEPVNPGKINSIMEGTSIEGEVKSDSNVRIDGRVKGTINVRGRLIVGASGLVEGDVTCQSSDIEGTVNGKITCQDLLSLKATAKLSGDIHTKKLSIEPGAVFTGNCSMGTEIAGSREPEPVRSAFNPGNPADKDAARTTPRPETTRVIN
jgi:cytoskeletal protein CcmA (bactofilin family)